MKTRITPKALAKTGSAGRGGILTLLLLVVLGAASFTALHISRIYREKEREIERLNQVVERLGAQSRVAQAVVQSQEKDPATGKFHTTIRFVEMDRQGKELAPRFFTVEGDVIYFDALVIRFEREYVERGDALRGKSLHLFRRVFGESQTPEQGFPIDEAASRDGVPDVYRVSENPSDLEVDLWHRFWEYAKDPAAARGKGVRVIQGEAVYTKFVPGLLYTITLDNAGGLSIQSEALPAVLKE